MNLRRRLTALEHKPDLGWFVPSTEQIEAEVDRLEANPGAECRYDRNQIDSWLWQEIKKDHDREGHTDTRLQTCAECRPAVKRWIWGIKD